MKKSLFLLSALCIHLAACGNGSTSQGSQQTTPPCSIDVTGTAGGMPASVLRNARCSFVEQAPSSWYGLAVHDIDIPPPQDLNPQKVATWTNYISRGGSIFSMIPFADNLTGLMTHSGSRTRDVTYVVASDFGFAEFQPDMSSYNLSALDTTQHTFTMTVTLMAQSYAMNWPPLDDGMGNVDLQASSGSLTGTITGTYEEFQMSP